MKKENMAIENNQEINAEELEQVNGGCLAELVGTTLAVGATVAIGAAALAGAAAVTAVGVAAEVAAESNKPDDYPPERCHREPEHHHRGGHHGRPCREYYYYY